MTTQQNILQNQNKCKLYKSDLGKFRQLQATLVSLFFSRLYNFTSCQGYKLLLCLGLLRNN